MFNVGDLVYQKRAEISFGLGVIIEISDRTAGPENPTVYAYQIYFANEKKRWLLEQNLELVSEAKNEL